MYCTTVQCNVVHAYKRNPPASICNAVTSRVANEDPPGPCSPCLEAGSRRICFRSCACMQTLRALPCLSLCMRCPFNWIIRLIDAFSGARRHMHSSVHFGAANRLVFWPLYIWRNALFVNHHPVQSKPCLPVLQLQKGEVGDHNGLEKRDSKIFHGLNPTAFVSETNRSIDSH